VSTQLREVNMNASLYRVLCSGTALTVLVAVLGAPKKW
jgi:hypothetical protein